MKYILAIDQSTSATKAILFDDAGALVARSDAPHRQIVSEAGWVSHNAEEIYENTLAAARAVVRQAGISPAAVAGAGISNQRETTLLWHRQSGRPLADAVVWQCARAAPIAAELAPHAERIRQITGLRLSPYFSAAKMAWLLRRHPEADPRDLCAGTMDSWLIYKLTGGARFAADVSNSARTQLLDIHTLCWSEEACALFGVPPAMLPQVLPSDAHFGDSDFGGLFPAPIPIHAAMGDSNGALLAQNCRVAGTSKATYGTGSSVMMNIGRQPIITDEGLVTSVAWGLGGKTSYVLEGNINYTGAVTRWVVDELKLLSSSREAGAVAAGAKADDATYLVPAFTGLGAPYWDSGAKALIVGMGPGTGRAELVKATEECIGYQIADIVALMAKGAGLPITQLRADGGPTRDEYLMQFQSDILGIPVAAAATEELSATGAATAAGLALGLYGEAVFARQHRREYTPGMDDATRRKKLAGWQDAVARARSGR